MKVATPDDAESFEEPVPDSYLSAAEKELLMKDKVGILITDIQDEPESDYGPKIIYTFQPAKGGMARRLSFTANPRRTAQAEGMRLALAKADALGPYYLDQVRTAKGNPSWVFIKKPNVIDPDTIPFG